MNRLDILMSPLSVRLLMSLAALALITLMAPAQVPPPPGEPATPSTDTPVPLSASEEIQVSFQGANIDMIVQWLSETTGKSVVKHPQAQCQITITSSKKLPVREAINLIYRALGLEGFTAVESGTSIFIVPEGKEPRLSPLLLDAESSGIPEGRQQLVKIFQLKSVPATEMREKVRGALSEKATVEINDRSNQIIITDYNDNVSLVANLIERLDTDQPGDLTVRVVPLRHASAKDLVKEITPLYQKLSGKPSSEPVEVSANERSNSLIILSSEANFRALQRIVETLDTADAQEKIMRLFPLKNADAEDVARQLKELASDQSNNRPRYYYFGPETQQAVGKMNIVADRRRNTVVVQAPPGQMVSIAKTIAALDEPVGGEALAPKIYPLKYVSAVDIEDILNELFLRKQQPRTYFFYDEPPEPTADRDVGRLYGKVRITSEPYSNAIIITANSRENLQAVEDVLRQLDVPSSNGESTFRVGLKYAKAINVANSINVLFAKGGSPALRPVAPVNPQNPQPQQANQQSNFQTQNSTPLERETKDDLYFPWLGGQPETLRAGDRSAGRQVSDLVGRVRVVPDHRSNSILVSANVHLFPQVVKLIHELDMPTAQVLIEARIVEVSTDSMDRLGVRWSPDGSQTFTAEDYDNSIIGRTRMNYLRGFGGNTDVNAADRGGVNTLRSGLLDVSVNLDVLIQFLRKNTDANVLAEPQISVEDNETGKLFVGSQVPFIYQSQNTEAGSLNQSFTYKDVGIILEVIPHINVTGDVLLRIRVESSTIVPGETILGGAVIDARTFRTDMTAQSGETIVLGGIIQKQFSETIRRVPILGSIPGLGWAFKKKDKTAREVELFVFLRPRVIRTAEDALKAEAEIEAKTPMIQEWLRQTDRQKATNSTEQPKP